LDLSTGYLAVLRRLRLALAWIAARGWAAVAMTVDLLLRRSGRIVSALMNLSGS